MQAVLVREYELMLNPALGAFALSSFADGFSKQGEKPLTLWHIVTVLPLVLNRISREAILKHRQSSGLRSILERDPEAGIAQFEATYNLMKRISDLQERTFRSLSLSLGAGQLVLDGGSFRVTRALRTPKEPNPEVRDIIRAAFKLGFWAGQLSAFEYLTVLGVNPRSWN